MGMRSNRMEPGKSVDGNSIWHVHLCQASQSQFGLNIPCPVSCSPLLTQSHSPDYSVEELTSKYIHQV